MLRIAGLAAFLLALPAAAAPPRAGVLVPGRSLGGLELGATPAQVRAAWGSTFGRCRDCRHTTWYFNLRPFRPQGAGVEFRRGRVVAVFTLSQPPGWRTSRGIALGENVARVTAVYGALARTECGLYSAFTLPSRAEVTAFYVRDGALWGFGLSRKGIPVCR
jgi:hypothetical protein